MKRNTWSEGRMNITQEKPGFAVIHQPENPNHTPGPWRNGPHAPPFGNPAEFKIWGPAGQGFGTVCKISNSENAPQPGCNVANAMLISAAPELLSALEAILAEYVSMVDSGDCGSGVNAQELEEVCCARAAIAKAKGDL